MPSPDVRGRQDILELYLQDKPVAGDVDIKAIARGTPGFNGAGTYGCDISFPTCFVDCCNRIFHVLFNIMFDDFSVDLANLVNIAAIKAAVEGAEKLTAAQLEFAKDRILMGTERKTMFISEESKKVST